jgi:hypothetical protein
MEPEITRVTVVGSTEWHSSEYRSVGRFHGSTTLPVKVKDEKGKPAMAASRWIRIFVRCADGISYRFIIDPFDVISRDGGASYQHDPSASVLVHGHWVSFEHWRSPRDYLPRTVFEAYRTCVLRLRVCARVMREQFRALPTYKPIPKKVVA